MSHSQFVDSLWAQWRERVDQRLDKLIPTADTTPANLHQAMRYASIGAGKRYRAALVYASGTALGSPEIALD
ncbi:MAG: hypothetical protein QF783_03320, partial [Arenicellales bacterium]|nr:hypothetical protein [Arenicellales bacterium]